MKNSLYSMTGFGSSYIERAGIKFQIQLRCVNQKGLRVNVKSKFSIGVLEKTARELIAKNIKRGNVDLFIEYTRTELSPDSMINQKMAKIVVDTYRSLISQNNLKDEIAISDIIRFPGIFDKEMITEFTDEESEVLIESVNKALELANKMRLNEGRATAEVLLGHLSSIEKFVEFAEKRSPVVVNNTQLKIKDRLAELESHLQNHELDQAIIEREVMIFADRSDISEETDRLNNHIKQFRDTVCAGGEAGKKLEFIAQEMLRETNTIASKGSDAEILTAAIESKLAIEKIKEQVANIE